MNKIKDIIKKLSKYDFNKIVDNLLLFCLLLLIFKGLYNILNSYNNLTLLRASIFTGFAMLFFTYIERK